MTAPNSAPPSTAKAQARRRSQIDNVSVTVTARLPLELWGYIVLLSCESLRDLAFCSAISPQIRAYTWDSIPFRVRVLVRRIFVNPPPDPLLGISSSSSSAPTNPFNWDFFTFLDSPDAHLVLRELIAAEILTPAVCPYAMMHAQHYRNRNVFAILLDSGFPSNAGMITVAASRGHTDIVQRLLEAPDGTSRAHSPVPLAAALPGPPVGAGLPPALPAAAPSPADAAFTRTAMATSAATAAAASGHLDTLNLLIRHGVRVDLHASLEAVAGGHAAVVARLIELPRELGEGVEPLDPALLREAVRWGRAEIVEMLLAHGVVPSVAAVMEARALMVGATGGVRGDGYGSHGTSSPSPSPPPSSSSSSAPSNQGDQAVPRSGRNGWTSKEAELEERRRVYQAVYGARSERVWRDSWGGWVASWVESAVLLLGVGGPPPSYMGSRRGRRR
ncbi:hypothetical protein DFJ73DRAFT_51882 [Zopfochytrium polystomum]|nr:hypothetical protein DFJ73DRAFT_51882 [Zopfochytrium polystomum]